MQSNPAPRAIIIGTGSEILQGLYPDTNATELSRRLSALGFEVVGHMALPDNLRLIVEGLRSTFGRCELVATTGGLGPTEDDLTRSAVAEAWGRPPKRVHRAVSLMRARYARRGRVLGESSLRQADLPRGCTPLLNFWGTAPGFLLPPEPGRPALAAFPGVPKEMREMAGRYLGRRIAPLFPQLAGVETFTLHVTGIPESDLNDLIKPWFHLEGDASVGVLASRGQLRIRVRTRNGRRPQEILDAVRGVLPPGVVYAEGPEVAPLEAAVLDAFRARGATIATAESCTGGGIAARLTSIAGSSDAFVEGFVAYSNEAKRQRLGVPQEILDAHGAVSGPCVEAMARGAVERAGASAAVSVSGIAGPGGGTPAKPVGTVWFGLADARGARSFHRDLGADRDTVRWRAEVFALDLLRRWALGLPLPDP